MTLMAYEDVRTRSGGHCEAMVMVEPIHHPELAGHLVSGFTRCGRTPVETHHRLTRGRGGADLDHVGESYHLMHLCRRCHMLAHDTASAFETGMLIEGSVVIENERPVYRGPDVYLSKTYGGTNA